MSDSGPFDVLAVGPHPDDVELFCGGIVIRLGQLGYRTAVLDLTEGELASSGDVASRRKETAAATRLMGLAHRENLGLPDTGIRPFGGDDRDPDSQCVKVVRALRRLQPELLLIPWTEARHPDHAAAGQLLKRAAFLAGVAKFDPSTPRFAPRRVLHYALRTSFTPSLIVDTTDAAGAKAKAIACYASQVAPKGVDTLIGAPGSVEAIINRDRYFGSQIGVAHGEPLYSADALAVIDPVRHFRDNDTGRAFFSKDSS